MEKHSLLIVDDESDNVDALERLFRLKYRVFKATSAKEGLNILDQRPGEFAVILTDQRMPEMTGVELLENSLSSQPDAIRILLTGYTDIESVIAAINSGQVYRYINKPWDPVDLTATIDRAVDRYNIGNELKQKNLELKAALDELKTLDQAKSQFMILINHELKTPLTSILSFTDLLKETTLNDEQQVCVNRIGGGAERLKELVDDTLLVVSAETKTLTSKPQPFDSTLIDLKLKPAIEKVQRTKDLSLLIQLPSQKMIGDVAHISQILRRLLHNAIKFSSNNSCIQIGHRLLPAHRVELFIQNSGPKISEAVIKKITQPFFLDEDVMKHSSGLGLGLTVCQALLKYHNSSLQFDNFQDKVRVSFELPYL